MMDMPFQIILHSSTGWLLTVNSFQWMGIIWVLFVSFCTKGLGCDLQVEGREWVLWGSCCRLLTGVHLSLSPRLILTHTQSTALSVTRPLRRHRLREEEEGWERRWRLRGWWMLRSVRRVPLFPRRPGPSWRDVRRAAAGRSPPLGGRCTAA